MNQVEELGRLAELRDKGVLTPKEFDQKKNLLLRGKGLWWKTALLWVIGIWAGVCLLSILVAIFVPAIRNWMAAENGLSCDSLEVKETATNVLNQQITNLKTQFGILGELALPGTQFHGIGDTQELYRDKESGFIACLATARSTEGEGLIAYTVSWQDRAAGKFWVELANPAQLRKQYSGEADTTKEVAPALSKSSRAEESNDVAQDTLAPATANAHAASGNAQSTLLGRCLLEVSGRKYIDGYCSISMRQDGSFSIGAEESEPLSYFAMVSITGKGVAEGHWNEEEGVNHAHTPLGELRFDEGCWQNKTAKVCAWK